MIKQLRNPALYSALFLLLSGSVLPILSAQQPPSSGNAETLHEGGQQYKEGNSLTSASDNTLIGKRGQDASNQGILKAIQSSKLNAFVAFFDNPVLGTQFEQFLSAPPETSEAAVTYQKNMAKIMDLLSPGNASKQNQDAAFNLLPKAAEFDSDANICNTIHDTVYAAASGRQEIQRYVEIAKELDQKLKLAQYNAQVAAESLTHASFAPSKTEQATYQQQQTIRDQAIMDPAKKEIADIQQSIQQNKMHMAMAESRTKFDFQLLIVQLFIQHRYEHVIIADRFYRALFNDGDQSLEKFQQMADQLGYNKEAGQAKLIASGNPNVSGALGTGNNSGVSAAGGTNGSGANVSPGGGGDGGAGSFSGVQAGVENLSVESAMNALSSGIKTTSRVVKSLGQLDALSNEIIHDVNEGVKSYKYLLDQNEVESATGQLISLWSKGRYLPSVTRLTQDEKRKSLTFAHLINKLINAGQAGSVDTITSTVAEMKKTASDFDDTAITAGVEAIKVGSSLHIAQARVAAAKGDMQTVQTEISRAAGIWPNNPEIKTFSADMTQISERVAPGARALSDFDQLYEQKNFRQIFDDKEKYIAVIGTTSPERKPKLQEVLSRMQNIETAIMKSQEIARHGDYAGAWEGLEIASVKYPDDQKLSQMRADLTIQAPDFVHDIRQAKSYEGKQEYGSALAWYLRSQSRYPMSDLSKEGIERVVKLILPDAT